MGKSTEAAKVFLVDSQSRLYRLDLETGNVEFISSLPFKTMSEYKGPIGAREDYAQFLRGTVEISPKGNYIVHRNDEVLEDGVATVPERSTLDVYRVDDLSQVLSVPWGGPRSSFRFSDDESMLGVAYSGDVQAIHLYDLKTGEQVLTLKEPEKSLFDFCGSSDCLVVESTPLDENGSVQHATLASISIRSGEILATSKVKFDDGMGGRNGISFLQALEGTDDYLVGYLSHHLSPAIVEVRSQKTHQVKSSFETISASPEFFLSDDGRRLYCVSYHRGAANTDAVFDVQSGKPLKGGQHAGFVYNAKLLSSPERLVTMEDGGAKIWTLPDKELLGSVFLTDASESHAGEGADWISILPEGYFRGSLGAFASLRMMHEGRVYDMRQLFDVFYRPDVVTAKLSGEVMSNSAGVSLLDEALQHPPPSVEFVGKPVLAEGGQTRLRYRIRSAGAGIGEIRAYHNGKLVIADGLIRQDDHALAGRSVRDAGEALIGAEVRGIPLGHVAGAEPISPIRSPVKNDLVEGEILIDPVSGENEIGLVAFNAENTVQSWLETSRFRSEAPQRAPRLFVLGIGIDDYLAPDADLRFAVKDVRELSAKIQAQTLDLYGAGNVHAEILTDEQATKANILATFDRLSAQVEPSDHFVLIVAAHGVLLGQGYHLVTHDYAGTLGDSSLISSNELMELSKRIKALNQLMVLDTCHAGGIGGIVGSVYDARLSVLARKMGLHIYASAQSMQSALDGYEGNGLFTYNLLDGLSDKHQADRDSNQVVSVVELGSYARDETAGISHRIGREQIPVILSFGQDRPLYRLGRSL